MTTRIPRENLHRKENLNNSDNTMRFLQETVKENTRLKERIKALELQQSQCDAFHAEAKLANESLQSVQKEKLKKADHLIDTMTERHKQELMGFVSGQIQKERQMEDDIIELKKVVSQMQKSVKEKDEIILENSNQEQKIQGLNKDLRTAAKEVALMKLTLSRFQQSKSDINDMAAREMEKLRDEKIKLADDISELTQVNAEMILKIKNLERELSTKCQEEVKQEFLVAMRKKVEKLSSERTALLEKLTMFDNVMEDNKNLRHYVDMLTNRLEIMDREKDKRDQAYEKLKAEFDSLREHTGLKKRKNKDLELPNFREFVELKREVQRLKESNINLKQQIFAESCSERRTASDQFMVLKDSSGALHQFRKDSSTLSRPPSAVSRPSSAASRPSSAASRPQSAGSGPSTSSRYSTGSIPSSATSKPPYIGAEPPSTKSRPPYAISRPASATTKPPSAASKLSSAAFKPPSAISGPSSTIPGQASPISTHVSRNNSPSIGK